MIEVRFLIDRGPVGAALASEPALFSPPVRPAAVVNFEAPLDTHMAVSFANGNPLGKSYPLTVPAGERDEDSVKPGTGAHHYDLLLSADGTQYPLRLATASDGEPSVDFALVPLAATGHAPVLRRRVVWVPRMGVRALFQNQTAREARLELLRIGSKPEHLCVGPGEMKPYDWLPRGPGEILMIVLSSSPPPQNGGTRLADIIVEPSLEDRSTRP